MKIVSACLVGINCKWNGKNNAVPKLVKEFKKGKLIPLCPEQLRGLPTPRPSCGVGKTWQMSKWGKGYRNRVVDGDGVLVALLRKNGIKVLSGEDF